MGGGGEGGGGILKFQIIKHIFLEGISALQWDSNLGPVCQCCTCSALVAVIYDDPSMRVGYYLLRHSSS